MTEANEHEELDDDRYDPYHHCTNGWNKCCELNQRKQERQIYMCSLRDKKHGHIKYGELALTYKRWHWNDELLFEELLKPRRLVDTACGLCIMCTLNKGKRSCLFPQISGTYFKWYYEQKRQWVETDGGDQHGDI